MPPTPRRGCTRVEVLLLAAVFVTGLGVALPALHAAQAKDARQRSRNNLRQIAVALHNCHDNYGRFPPTAGTFLNKQGSLLYFLLPYLEQQRLFQDGDVSVPVTVFQSPLDTSVPADHRYKGWLATTSYAVNWLVFLDQKTVVRMNRIVDGLSNTLALAERHQMCGGHPCGWGYSGIYYWTPMFAHYTQAKYQLTPKADRCDPALAQALDARGLEVALLDGSVRVLGPHLTPTTWIRACDPADGQLLGADFNDAGGRR